MIYIGIYYYDIIINFYSFKNKSLDNLSLFNITKLLVSIITDYITLKSSSFKSNKIILLTFDNNSLIVLSSTNSLYFYNTSANK